MTVLSDGEIAAALGGLPEWTRHGNSLVRDVGFADWEHFELQENIHGIAESFDHEAEISTGEDTFQVSVTARDARGLTSDEIELATAIDGLISETMNS